VVHPTVFCPNISYHFMGILPYPTMPGSRFLDVGSGCGILGIHAAISGVPRVLCTDVVPAAKANVEENARLHKVSEKVEARTSNVFSAIKAGEKFDLIFWNYPFVPDYTGRDYSEVSDVERGIRDPGQKHLRAYCEGARAIMKPGARLLITYSGTMGDTDTFQHILTQTNWKAQVLHDLAPKGPQVQLFELLDKSFDSVVEDTKGASRACACCAR